MSQESQALLNEFKFLIENTVKDTVENLLINQEVNNPLLNLSDEELTILDSLSLTPQQIIVFRKVMMALGQRIVFNLLCIVDGVYDAQNIIPDLAIVDRATNKDITDQFWHDEFIETITG